MSELTAIIGGSAASLGEGLQLAAELRPRSAIIHLPTVAEITPLSTVADVTLNSVSAAITPNETRAAIEILETKAEVII